MARIYNREGDDGREPDRDPGGAPSVGGAPTGYTNITANPGGLPYWQNPDASVANGANPYGPMLARRGNVWYLTEHGNERQLANDDEITSARGYVDQFWKDYPTGDAPSHKRPSSTDPTASGYGGPSSGGSEGYDYGMGEWGFDDPYTSWFEDILRGRVNSLMSPVNLPGAEALRGAISQRQGELSQPLQTPDLDAYVRALKTYAGQLNHRPDNQYFNDAMAYGKQRFNELQAPPFTGTQEAAQEVQAFDQLESDRQAARAQVMERMGARGVGMGSGIVEKALQEVDRRFDQMRSQRTNDLLLYRTEEGQRRRDAAFGLGATLSDMWDTQQDEADARMGKITDVFGQVAGVETAKTGMQDARSNQLVALAGMLSDLDFDEFALNDSRGQQAVLTAAVLPDMVERRLSLALNALNGGTSSTMPLGSQLGTLMNWQTAGRANAPRTDWGSMFGGLGSLLGAFGSMFGNR